MAPVRPVLDMPPVTTADNEPMLMGVARALGVKVEASYTVGEYDVVIVSAQHSDGLETWLAENGFRVSLDSARTLRSYVHQGMKFLVARAHLGYFSKTGQRYLRPLQLAFESDKFMLPLRLGMLNAEGPQDMIAYVLTRRGRVEASNYRTLKLSADIDAQMYIRNDFSTFYRATFDRQALAEGQRVVFTEYFSDASTCKPCTTDPLTFSELRRAGVYWLDGYDVPQTAPALGRSTLSVQLNAPSAVMLTRLHVRFAPQTFPEDLVLRETVDRDSFQTRYFGHRMWARSFACPDDRYYLDNSVRREDGEIRQVAAGNIEEVRSADARPVTRYEWWQRVGR
jgi:hypothetical protein